jgi:hypothetical protein
MLKYHLLFGPSTRLEDICKRGVVSTLVFFPSEILLFFNKEIGKILDFFFLVQIQLILLIFLVKFGQIFYMKKEKKHTHTLLQTSPMYLNRYKGIRLRQKKMVATMSRNRIVHAANEMTEHIFKSSCFSFGGGKDENFNFLCSHHVPNDVPQVPNSTSLYLISFAQSSPCSPV